MDCCKCKSQLLENKHNGKTYYGCNICKGIFIHKSVLAEIFKDYDTIHDIILGSLTGEKQVEINCPECNKFLVNGKIANTDLIVDRCSYCDHYFFDEKEMHSLLDYLNVSHLPSVDDIDWSKEEIIKSGTSCLDCKTEPLYMIKCEEKAFEVCIQCNGLLTTVDHLHKLAGKTLFGASMFKFRMGGHIISYCRYCSQAQDKNNKNCIKCSREITKFTCSGCNGKLSEYELDNLIIDRCQICNNVWLDSGEFEKLLTVLPDVKKYIEACYEDQRFKQLKSDVLKEVQFMQLHKSHRHMIRSIWGKLITHFVFRE